MIGKWPPNSPQIKEGIRILWESGRYDGPLSGVLEYQGQKCYFDLKRDYMSRRLSKMVGRTYWVYKLTEEQWKEIEYWHEEFRFHVGTHCDYTWNEEKKDLERGFGKFSNDMNYCKEMYYDRYSLFAKEARATGGTAHDKIVRKTQTIGWITWDVLVGRPWKEWKK